MGIHTDEELKQIEGIVLAYMESMVQAISKHNLCLGCAMTLLAKNALANVYINGTDGSVQEVVVMTNALAAEALLQINSGSYSNVKIVQPTKN